MKSLLLIMFASWMSGCVTDEPVTSRQAQEVTPADTEADVPDDMASGQEDQPRDANRQGSSDVVTPAVSGGASRGNAPGIRCC
jgi:hypothetical protein